MRFNYFCSRCGLAHSNGLLLGNYTRNNNSRRATHLHLSRYTLLRRQSTINLREVPLQIISDEDEESTMEREYAELKRAMGIAQTTNSYNAEQLLLIHPRVKRGREILPKNTTPQLQVEEAQALCQTIPGFRVISSIIVNTDNNAKKKLIWKEGRLTAIKEHKQQHNISAIMVNVDVLSPLQQHELSAYFSVPIYDRYNIVLNIFKLYAQTKEAKLQIALAEIPYIRERLRFLNDQPRTSSESLHVASALSSLKNSDGCKKMDILRMREHGIKKQIKMAMETTKRELAELKMKGGAAKIPVIGVIGYTNAGKTTLIKKLTDSRTLLGENRLFATLDTTTHHATLPSSNKIIFADTIGFISNLPFKLFASFAATLQHIENADLLIHVMDLSHPDLLAQKDNVLETLENLKIRTSLLENILNVGNKLDKCDRARREELAHMDILCPNGESQTNYILPISCRTTEGMPELIQQLDKSVQRMNGSRVRRLRLTLNSKAIPYLYSEGFIGIPPVPSECQNFLTFDVVMNDHQFAKFQTAIGTQFKRKEEGKESEESEYKGKPSDF